MFVYWFTNICTISGLAHTHSHKRTKRSDASYSQESIASFSYHYTIQITGFLPPPLWTTMVQSSFMKPKPIKNFTQGQVRSVQGLLGPNGKTPTHPLELCYPVDTDVLNRYHPWEVLPFFPYFHQSRAGQWHIYSLGLPSQVHWWLYQKEDTYYIRGSSCWKDHQAFSFSITRSLLCLGPRYLQFF